MTERDSSYAIVTTGQVNLGALSVDGPRGVITQAKAVAEELAKLVRDKKLSVNLQGREYVKVEGWSTLGAMLGVLPREVSVERQEDGGYLAVVELVRVSDGAIIGRGSALCGMDEHDRNGNLTWGSRAEYARRSMAITRATGKAYRLGFSWIMTLAGYEPTPAEEMDGVIEGHVIDLPKPEKAQPKPDAQPEPQVEKMALETALAVVSSEGEAYGEISTEKLVHMFNSLAKKLKLTDLPAEERETCKFKQDAINVILHSRK
jgi:hypothetical protein